MKGLFVNDRKLILMVIFKEINGKVVKKWKAVSGRTPYHWYISPSTWKKRYTMKHEEWAKYKNEGPTPPGKYTLGETQKRSSSDDKWKTDAQYAIRTTTRATISGIPGSNIKDDTPHEFINNTDSSKVAWGDYRWSLVQMKGTKTYGRDSFYLHGGSFPGSIGCIDLVTDSGDFADFYEKWKKENKKDTITVSIDYSKFNKDANIDVDSQPYKMPKFNGDKEWFDKSNSAMADSLRKDNIKFDPTLLNRRS